jgi:hypothetical protein
MELSENLTKFWLGKVMEREAEIGGIYSDRFRRNGWVFMDWIHLEQE